MWHPGQLSAWNQNRLLMKSQERCVNVGYPGNFYKKSTVATFINTFSAESVMDYVVASSGDATILLDGVQSGDSGRIERGNHCLEIKVSTVDRLPSVKIKGCNDLSDPGKWSVSTDGESWVPVEFDPNERAGLLPDDDQESVFEIVPESMEIARANGEWVKTEGTVSLDKGDVLLVDFMENELGTVRFKGNGEASLKIIVGESRKEALDDNPQGFEQRAIDDIHLNVGSDYTLPERALRYLSITPDGPCSLSDFIFSVKLWPTEPYMTFECDDEQLNRLFDSSVKTQVTSIHGGFSLDGIKRDFLPWAMDGVESSMSLGYLFRDRQVGRNGISVALLPPSPEPSDIGIMDYPLHGLLGIEEDFLCYGDLDTWHMYRDRALAQAALYESLQDERGFIFSNDLEWGFITGWNTDNGPASNGTPCYAQMLLMKNFRILSFFLEKDGDSALSAHYKDKALALEESIRSCFYDKVSGGYYNGFLKDGSLDRRLSHHTQYWGIFTGMISPQTASSLLRDAVLSLPHYKENVSYEKGYEAVAWAKCGMSGLFIDEVLRPVFLRWLDSGYTRFPENFRVFDDEDSQLTFYKRPYGLSLCHGANGSAVPITVLYGILGLQRDIEHPQVPLFKPDMMGLNRIEAEVPLYNGKLLKMTLVRDGESVVTVPEGERVRFVIHGKEEMLKGGKTYTF